MNRLTISIGILAGTIFWSCDPGLEKITASDPNTCEGCHTSEASVKKYASTESETATGGG